MNHRLFGTGLAAEFRTADREDDLEAIRLTSENLTGDGIVTLEMAQVAQRLMAASIPEVASVDITKTFTNEFTTEAK